jgi:hypothetical protein
MATTANGGGLGSAAAPLGTADSQGVQEATAEHDAKGDPATCWSAEAFERVVPSLKTGFCRWGTGSELETV